MYFLFTINYIKYDVVPRFRLLSKSLQSSHIFQSAYYM